MDIVIALTEEEKKRLKTIFSFMINYSETEILKGIMEAAKEEYIGQFLKDGNQSSLTEIRQYKLFLLIKHVFNGLIPSEVEVASIFKIPITSARSLIKNTKSRYQFEIEQYFKETIKAILNQIDENEIDNDYYQLYIRSSYMLIEMNRVIELMNQNFEKIKRLNNVSSYYKISSDSRTLLLNYSNS
jgi:hypothetical protein